MNVQALSASGVAQTAPSFGTEGTRPAGGMPPMGPPPPEFGTITNDEGLSLLDIHDQVQSAVKSALEDADGEQDVRKLVEEAIDSTLEANGFDPEEVKSAMKEAGIGPRKGMGPGEASPENLQEIAAGFDPTLVFTEGKNEEELVQSFFEQLRSGSTVNLMI